MATPKQSRLLLLLFTLFSMLALASPAPAESPTPSATAEPLNCSSKFSGDYYGLGVRVGIYCIWLTSWLANAFVEEEISGALDANSIFLFALLVSTFKGSAVSGVDKLAYIDGLVLTQLCAGYLFGTHSLWGYRTSHYQKEGPRAVRHFGKIGTHCRLILALSISVYGIWFWTYGIRYDLHHGLAIVTDDAGVPRPPQCYPVYLFFFAKLNVLGGIRILYIIMSTCTAAYYGAMLLAAIAERIRHLTQVIRQERGHERRETFKYETGLSRKELDILFNINRTFNLIWIAFSITSVELTLNWNHSTAVIGPNGKITYPAQLLPMMIGALSFVRMCWILFQRWLHPEPDCCDETEVPTGEPTKSKEVPSATPNAGLGLLSSPSPGGAAAGTEQDYNQRVTHRRSLTTRYLVAYLPWLSQFEFWKNPKGHRKLQNSPEVYSHNYRDSPLTDVRTSYKYAEEADVEGKNGLSSVDTSPMISMKSPTSVNSSPMMNFKS